LGLHLRGYRSLLACRATKDLDLLMTRLLSREVLTEGDIRQRKLDYATSVTWGESLAASGVFIAIMLGLACWRFATKDY